MVGVVAGRVLWSGFLAGYLFALFNYVAKHYSVTRHSVKRQSWEGERSEIDQYCDTKLYDPEMRR